MKKTNLTILLTFCTYIAFGQDAILQDYFNSVAAGKRKAIAKSDMQILYKDNLIDNKMVAFLSDSILRRDAVRLIGRIGNKHQAPAIRQKIVHQLLDVGLENTPRLTATILDKLINFNRKDFDDKALVKVEKILSSSPTHIGNWILLAGFLGRKNVLNEIKEQYENNKKVRRNIGFALSRAGDQKKMTSMMKSLQKAPKGDAFIHQVAPMLIYVRQKEVFDYLLEIISSNDKDCRAGGDHRSTKVLCGYRMMEMLAPYIIDFPLKVDEYGEVIINDYKSDLTRVRAWMMEHFETYKLRTDVY